MKINKSLKIGVLLLFFFFIIDVLGNFFFAIRNNEFYTFVKYLELFSFLSISIVLTFGLYKLPSNWKWIIIIPVSLFNIIYLLGTILLTFPNEITFKEDTELLYINSNNNNKKIIRQVYFTGITGTSYHSDTVVVYDFSPWLRLESKAQNNKIDCNWIKVYKPE